jgi:hypothetical protein
MKYSHYLSFLPILIFSFQSLSAQARDVKYIKVHKELYTLYELLMQIKDETGMLINLPSASELKDKKIRLKPKAYQLMVILDKIALRLNMKCQVKGNSITFTRDHPNTPT